MEDTLKSKLEQFSDFRSMLTVFGSNLNFSLDEKDLESAKVQILEQFYENNSLAYDVAQGMDSYKTRIEPIEEKYDSFLNRFFIPSKDKDFDKEVYRVIGSMNSVGESYISPEFFTISEKKSDQIASSVIQGGVLGLLGGSILANYVGLEAFIATIPVCVGTIYLSEKLHSGFIMKSNLKALRDVAKRTDEFLIKNYI